MMEGLAWKYLILYRSIGDVLKFMDPIIQN